MALSSNIQVAESMVLPSAYLQGFLARGPFPFTDPNDAHAFLQKNRERGQEHGVQWLEQGLKIRFLNEVIDLDKAHYWVYYPVKRTRSEYQDQGVSVQIHYAFPVPGAKAYYDPGDGQVQPVPDGEDFLDLGPLVWVRTFAQRLEDKSEAGTAHNRRVVALRKLLYEYSEMLTGSIPALRASWDYDEDDEDEDSSFVYDLPPAWPDDDLSDPSEL